MDPLFDETDIKVLASAVKTLGVDTITGNIYEDRSFKHTDKWGEGWCWDDDNPNLSPLLVGGKDMAATVSSPSCAHWALSSWVVSVKRQLRQGQY